MPRHSLGDLRDRHRELVKLLDDLERVHERKGERLEAAERQIARLRDEIGEREKAVAVATRELRSARDLLAKATGDKDASQAKRDHLAAVVEAAKRKLTRVTAEAAEIPEIRELIGEVAKRIAAKRDERHDLHERITAVQRKKAQAEARIQRRIRGKLDAIDCLDGCAMPRGLKVALLDCREHGWDGTVNSGDRTVRNCDRCSDKSSQAELYAAFLNGTGAPANPPGTGTHEYVNDGTAYPGEPAGKRMPWWALGLDLTLGDQLVAIASALGYQVRRPYLPREPWHVNFAGSPEPVLKRRDRIPGR